MTTTTSHVTFKMESMDTTRFCYPVLHVDRGDWKVVYDNIAKSSYDVSNYDDLLQGTDRESSIYYMPNILLDPSDERSEHVHYQDSVGLLIILFLLSLTIITIWIFKVTRFRILHETGLAIIYGVIIGIIIHYAFPAVLEDEYYLAVAANKCNQSEHHPVDEFEVGDSIILKTVGGDDFRCSIASKVFKTREGDKIEESLLFDPELFFFVILPPIIFYAGYCLQKRHFFRNLGSLMMFAFAGTTMSCFLIGALMYGWALSGVDNYFSEQAQKANLTLPGSPEHFNQSIIPSLLFGSLISATDPVTVLAIFHDLHVDHDLYSLVFGESVLNDAVAIVLFRSVDEYSGEGDNFDAGSLFISVGSFIGIFLGSFVLGVFIGIVTALLMKFSKLRQFPLLETSMFILLSYSSFVIAELCSLTGIVAVLFCGITQSYYTYINMSHESRRRTKEFFELVNFIAENFVFSYMGLSLFTFENHQWVPGFISFSFVAIFAGRVVNIYILSFLLNLGRSKKISFRFQHMLVFAGLRGAIAFALAIRNTQREDRQLIFTTTLVIVLATVFVCGGLTTLALQFLKIRVGVHDEDDTLNEDGQEIPYDKDRGNLLISKFSKFDMKYLIPLMTHRGRPLESVFPKCCPSWCIGCCYKCKPQPDELEEESSQDSSSSDEELSSDEDKVVSFRDTEYTQSHSGYDVENLHMHQDEEGGDIGLGSTSNSHLYRSEESNL